MTQQIKNFIEEGEMELHNFRFSNRNELVCIACNSRDFVCKNCIKQFISSRQISLIKMIVDDNIKTIENLKNNYYNENRDKGVCQSIIGVLKLTDGK
jgi:hypothetical protein